MKGKSVLFKRHQKNLIKKPWFQNLRTYFRKGVLKRGWSKAYLLLIESEEKNNEIAQEVFLETTIWAKELQRWIHQFDKFSLAVSNAWWSQTRKATTRLDKTCLTIVTSQDEKLGNRQSKHNMPPSSWHEKCYRVDCWNSHLTEENKLKNESARNCWRCIMHWCLALLTRPILFIFWTCFYPRKLCYGHFRILDKVQIKRYFFFIFSRIILPSSWLSKHGPTGRI